MDRHKLSASTCNQQAFRALGAEASEQLRVSGEAAEELGGSAPRLESLGRGRRMSHRWMLLRWWRTFRNGSLEVMQTLRTEPRTPHLSAAPPAPCDLPSVRKAGKQGRAGS